MHKYNNPGQLSTSFGKREREKKSRINWFVRYEICGQMANKRIQIGTFGHTIKREPTIIGIVSIRWSDFGWNWMWMTVVCTYVVCVVVRSFILSGDFHLHSMYTVKQSYTISWISIIDPCKSTKQARYKYAFMSFIHTRCASNRKQNENTTTTSASRRRRKNKLNSR